MIVDEKGAPVASKQPHAVTAPPPWRGVAVGIVLGILACGVWREYGTAGVLLVVAALAVCL